MLVKIIVVGLFLLIIGSLGSALFYMLKESKDSDRVVRALTYRVGLSVLAFLLLMIGSYFGWIQPHGLQPGL